MASDDSREQELYDRILQGDVRALARILTLVENRDPLGSQLHRRLYPHTGKAHIIGVTGSPGAGKSSLVNELALELSKAGHRVAVLAVDPSSPYSGGAVLGDRIRMEQAVEHQSIYVRSMASRGALGGLSNAAADALDVLDAFGFTHVLVETVGVGQGEVDIARTAHTSVVVLVPGMGDEVQVMKAGILEIADLFVINKADRPGVHPLERELRILLMLNPEVEKEWKIPILRTIATKPSGIPELVEQMKLHREWLMSTGRGVERAQSHLSERIVQLSSRLVIDALRREQAPFLQQALDQCLKRERDPHSVAEDLLRAFRSVRP